MLRQAQHELLSLAPTAVFRLMEAMRLRVKDIDFERKKILIRDGKGAKDRVAMLPVTLVDLLQRHLQTVKALHDDDLQAGYGKFICPTRWSASIRMPPVNGAGSMCFRRHKFRSIRVSALPGAITWTRKACSVP